jgi:hypothetical protein
VAATAEARDLTVLHYDADFKLVAEVTGQHHEWIVCARLGGLKARPRPGVNSTRGPGVGG